MGLVRGESTPQGRLRLDPDPTSCPLFLQKSCAPLTELSCNQKSEKNKERMKRSERTVQMNREDKNIEGPEKKSCEIQS